MTDDTQARSPLLAALRVAPTFAWMWQDLARVIALALGSGLPRFAPGTWGTVFAWVSFNYVIRDWLGDLTGEQILVFFATVLAVGTWAATRAGEALGEPDSGHIVIDEVLAFWLILSLLPANVDPHHHRILEWWAFGLFRAFDIVKPPPIRWLERRLSKGFGVMADDLLAAVYTLLTMTLLWRWLDWANWLI